MQDAQCAICVPVKEYVKRTRAAQAQQQQQQQQQQAQSQPQQQAQLQPQQMPQQMPQQIQQQMSQQGGMPNMGMQPGHQVCTGGGERGRAWGHAGEGASVYIVVFGSVLLRHVIWAGQRGFLARCCGDSGKMVREGQHCSVTN